jgi:hypothetical protein
MQPTTITRSRWTSAVLVALAAILVAVPAVGAHASGTAGQTPSAVVVANLTMIDRSGNGLPVLAAPVAPAALVVPAVLQPPAGNVLNASFDAEGVQVYKCVKADIAPPAWTLVEPAATLKGQTVTPRKRVTAIHFRGPSWESPKDGSLVEGKAVANSPVAGSIPQLLIQATRTQGTGIFGATTFVQRLATTGGAAPAGACTEGAVTGVPYTAVYRFFVAG